MRQGTYETRGVFGTCRLAYVEWGNNKNPNVMICVHGLTGNARDFDFLAARLSATHRVIALDIPGRGNSDWLADANFYTYETYSAIVLAFIAHLDVQNINWIGTSMGGILGMMLAATPGNRIGKMVINDVGPFLPRAALQRIALYLSMDFQFQNAKQIEQHLRRVHEPFGPLTDAQWAHLAHHSSVQDKTGNWRLKYDPAIVLPFKTLADDDISFWPVWDAITCAVLLIRGQNSDILLSATAREMLTRGPQTELVEFAKIGHAPALMDIEQIGVIEKWFNND